MRLGARPGLASFKFRCQMCDLDGQGSFLAGTSAERIFDSYSISTVDWPSKVK
jgi:hypothetical protein